ncbi:hypothetical protein RGQ29_017596 [Quercus rubra]|uniref:Uncharacterized protein n=1 Tax=Quercus rubra TaxID=3512 RepID=A0AAN7IXY8_QUERU|nr:hypothetical protein RGQ29_017596 [Quercus rubra]
MRGISNLLSLVLIHGLLLSHFSYMGDASQDFSHKLKVVSHRGSASPPPSPQHNLRKQPIRRPPIRKSPPPPPPPPAPSANG